MKEVSRILDTFRDGLISREEALSQLNTAYVMDLGHSTIDLQRVSRSGASEVIFGASKAPEQIADIFAAMVARGQNVLATRISREAADAVCLRVPEAAYHALSQTLQFCQEAPRVRDTSIAVVCAGTSDLAASEEAARTAEFYGNPVVRITDVGIAGLHRLLLRVEEIRNAKVVVVAAGMEGALPSVVGGLVSSPVIALPTSVGYGASLGGVSALLGMLNSCASNVCVVNIDNGFGAGYMASLINGL